MCGIAGFFSFSSNTFPMEADIKKMIEAIRHRGPDGEGVYLSNACALGHKRLAIIDLTKAAAQPMRTDSGQYVITFNGEIYNYLALKKDLVAKGCTFKSNSDTEVLLNYYQEFGLEGIKNINGHFAFAIYDVGNNKLSLFRDRFGVKPLYYYMDDNKFLFASEIKGILPLIKSELNAEVLPSYFSFQNIFSNETLFKNVNILMPGEYLEITSEGVFRGRYHDICFQETDFNIGIDDVKEALELSVKRQLQADVDVNAYLSGGIDSGLISLYASKHTELKTFTVGFDLEQITGIELNFDERGQAERMSSFIGSEHYNMVLKAGDMERCLDSVVYHLEEPRIGQCFPNYYAAKLASSFGKVVLSGVGGDELFGGYVWRYFQTQNVQSLENYKDRYFSYWQRLLNSSELHSIFGANNKENIERARKTFDTVLDSCIIGKQYSIYDQIQYSLAFEAKTFLHGLLCVEDKLSMAFGLETRAPFLDNDLLKMAERMPLSLKINASQEESIRINENIQAIKKQIFYQQTHNGKLILRDLMAKELKNKVSIPGKQGFSAPDASWFKGKSIDLIRSNLLSKNQRIWEHLDYKYSRQLIMEHLEGKKNRRLFLWSLLYLNRFLKVFSL